jgi:hypothetical protein
MFTHDTMIIVSMIFAASVIDSKPLKAALCLLYSVLAYWP